MPKLKIITELVTWGEASKVLELVNISSYEDVELLRNLILKFSNDYASAVDDYDRCVMVLRKHEMKYIVDKLQNYFPQETKNQINYIFSPESPESIIEYLDELFLNILIPWLNNAKRITYIDLV